MAEPISEVNVYPNFPLVEVDPTERITSRVLPCGAQRVWFQWIHASTTSMDKLFVGEYDF